MDDYDRRIIDLAARHPTYTGRMDDEIREMGMSAHEYFQRLTRLLRSPEAEAYDPITIHRLQRRQQWRR